MLLARLSATRIVTHTARNDGVIGFVLSELWSADPIGTQAAQVEVVGGRETMYTWSLIHDATGRFVISPVTGIVQTALAVAAGVYEIKARAIGLVTRCVLTLRLQITVQASVGGGGGLL